MALVTILIPTYNRAHFLKEAVQSALAQTHDDIEIVVLDDASSDDTPQLMEEFAANARVRYVRHPRNLGVAGNWRAGLQEARGRYFCLLHDDDALEPEFVARLLEPMERDPDLILAFCDHWVMDDAGTRLIEASDEASRYFGRDKLAPGEVEDLARAALLDYSVPVGATLFRRALVAPKFLDERARGSIDMYLLLGCVTSGHRAFYRAERLMNYRLHDAGMSHSQPVHMAQGHVFRFRSILAQPALSHLHPEIRQALRATLAGTAVTLAASGQAGSARRWARAAWHIRPDAKALLALALGCSGRWALPIACALRRLRNR